jgi:hypothetical protein
LQQTLRGSCCVDRNAEMAVTCENPRPNERLKTLNSK